jgi:hypothetical protein
VLGGLTTRSAIPHRSVHDNNVYAFAVLCEQRRIVLHTEYRDGGAEEYTDVVFDGVVAHHFEDVLEGNILFGVEEVILAGNGYITGQTINVNGGWYMS